MERRVIYLTPRESFIEVFQDKTHLGVNVDLESMNLKELIPCWKNNNGKVICLPYDIDNVKKYKPFTTLTLGIGVGNALINYHQDIETMISDVSNQFIIVHNAKEDLKDTVIETVVNMYDKEHHRELLSQAQDMF